MHLMEHSLSKQWIEVMSPDKETIYSLFIYAIKLSNKRAADPVERQFFAGRFFVKFFGFFSRKLLTWS